MVKAQLQAVPAYRPPRSMAWVILLASAIVTAGIGALATWMVLGRPSAAASEAVARQVGAGYWSALAIACLLTLASVGVRTLRWIFLLRRAEVRIPIRDAYIGYLAGFSLLVAPVLAGEIALRAYVHRARARVPIAAIVVVNVWERVLDLAALIALAGGASLLTRGWNREGALLLAASLMPCLPAVRRQALQAIGALAQWVARAFGEVARPHLDRVSSGRVWGVGFSGALVAWLLPGLALRVLAESMSITMSAPLAAWAYVSSTLAGAVTLAPAGIVVTGRELIEGLGGGAPVGAAVLVVLGFRLATVGVATGLGVVFLLLHVRTRPQPGAVAHFDDIADAYDVQIPEARRDALLALKTGMMREWLTHEPGFGPGVRGLDVGCGQGWYVRRMNEIGFAVAGIDASAGQVEFANAHLGPMGRFVSVGSALAIPARDENYDFAYTINVLHHLASIDEQRAALVEIFRVLRPGGVLFIHEINTRNWLFRLYMGYVFPSLNCIDEGVERWLLPHHLDRYAPAGVTAVASEIRYFTFLPDFLPQAVVRALSPIERALERSRWRIYSAHYMAVLRKSA